MSNHVPRTNLRRRRNHHRRQAIAAVMALIATLVLAGSNTAAAQNQDCWPTDVPVGALPSMPPPIFCSLVTGAGSTAESGPNTWIDDFDHGLSLADMSGSGYQVFEDLGNAHRTLHWRHADHWMVDIAPDAPDTAFPDGSSGGAMLSPDRTFRFEDGALVIETELAASMPGYQVGVGSAWGEVDISTGSAPDDTGRPGALYGYDHFPGHWTLGCRYQPDSHVVCSLMDDTERGLPDGRVWEMSFFQHVGTEVFGGGDWVGGGSVFDECGVDEPDGLCRMNFRLELTETSVEVFVNGERYFAQSGIPSLPSGFMDADLHVYASSMFSRVPGDTVRFHWDRFAVNPEGPLEPGEPGEPPSCPD